MSDEEIREMLEQYGFPPHVVKAGRSGLIAEWRKFVEQVERGYRFGLYDYRNDLDTRGIIARLGLEAEVAALDERFRAALVHPELRVWESDSADAFWIFGYPRSVTEEFMQDLRGVNE